MGIALVGFSRFPVFYSPDGSKILGGSSGNIAFDKYVDSIKKKRSAVISNLADISYRRRFIVEEKAINPSLDVEETIPRHMYVYPNVERDDPLTNVYALGFILKGLRTPVYVPMLSYRYLEKEEVDALLNVVKIRDFPLERMVEFVRSLGIVIGSRELIDGIAFTITDTAVSGPYQVLTDKEGRVRQTNFCIGFGSQLYLPELIMLTRQTRYLDIFPPRW
jgi:hypothetical protein